jgi:hypothetical protein
MKINPFHYGILVITVFFGTILSFQVAGVWLISGKVDASGATIQPSAADVNTVKGWMILEQVITTYDVSLENLITQFKLPADTAPSAAIKDLESDTFNTTALKTWLLERVNPASTPASQSTSTTSPTFVAFPTAKGAVESTPIPTEHSTPTNTITGKTTFQELVDWGVSKDAIQKVIGGNLPAPPTTVIKDYVTGKGLEFPSVKTQLQAEVDKLKP